MDDLMARTMVENLSKGINPFTGEDVPKTDLCANEEIHLGIPVPAGDAFVLETRIPVKRLPEGEFRFVLLPRHRELEGKFIPLSPQEPFAYLSRLKDAYLEKRDGSIGIVIPEDGKP